MSRPSIYPTGVTQYDPSRASNGYTFYVSALGGTLIDMSGRLVRVWPGLTNPTKPLDNGHLLASRGSIPGAPGAESLREAAELDWDGRAVWAFDHTAQVADRDGRQVWASCHHHDLERDPATGRTLLLTHHNVYDTRISDKLLLDERIVELDGDGRVVWTWDAHEHIDEMGLSEAARRALFADPLCHGPGTPGDWIHLNACSTLGPNRHFDAGDARFAPENVLCSSRQLNILFLIDKATGRIVWRLGPDYSASPEQAQIGQIIGQHNAHMIPKGLPGAGNILVFDNGSFGGYGAPNPMAPDGVNAVRRHWSRAVEIDPAKLERVWEYCQAQRNAHDVNEMNAQNFFSPYISSVQRLPNGNTLIDQGADGHFIEVTPEGEIVWEFINPFCNPHMPPLMRRAVYRAYRVPYGWAPVPAPVETAITPPDIDTWRVPGAPLPGDPAQVTCPGE